MTNVRESRDVLALLVGVAAGVESAQIAKVHLFAVATVAYVLASARRPMLRRQGWLMLLAAGLLASTVFYGPLVNSRSTGVQLGVLAFSGALIAGTANRAQARRMLTGLLTIVTVAAMLAVLQYVHVLPLSLFHSESRPTGLIYREPDFLGVFCALGALLAIRSTIRGVWRYLIVGVNVAAVLLSGARASWLAFGAAVALMLLLTIFTRARAGTGSRPWRTLFVLAVVVTVAFIAVPQVRHKTLERVQTAVSNDRTGSESAISAQARKVQDAGLRRLAATAPWYGQGLTASGRVDTKGVIQYTGRAPNNVGTNWVLSWWAEGKWLAIPLMAVFMATALWRSRRTEGLLLVLVLVNNLYSNTSLLPISWFLLGVALVSARPVKQRGRHSDWSPSMIAGPLPSRS